MLQVLRQTWQLQRLVLAAAAQDVDGLPACLAACSSFLTASLPHAMSAAAAELGAAALLDQRSSSPLPWQLGGSCSLPDASVHSAASSSSQLSSLSGLSGALAAAGAAASGSPSGPLMMLQLLQHLTRLPLQQLLSVPCLVLLGSCVAAMRQLQAARAQPPPSFGGDSVNLFQHSQPLTAAHLPSSSLPSSTTATGGGSSTSTWSVFSALPSPGLAPPHPPPAVATDLSAAGEALRALLAHTLAAGARSIVAADGRADPAITSATLRLAQAALGLCPEAVVGGAGEALEGLMLLTQLACRTYHLDQCGPALDWTVALASAPYAADAQARRAASQAQLAGALTGSALSSLQSGFLGAPAGSGGGGGGFSFATVSSVGSAATPDAREASAAALLVLRRHLEAGAGARLVLCLLLAAAGDMPPDAMMQIAGALHAMWLAVGTQQLAPWLEGAVVHLAPASAPWAQQKQVTRAAFLRDLLDPACTADLTRFKRLLKLFCGGKKKGSKQ